LIARVPRRRDIAVSVKVLDPIVFPPRLDDLNLPTDVVDVARTALQAETGLMIVSSPPLSGSTSTAYALAMDTLAGDRQLGLLESPRAVKIESVIQEEYFAESSPGLADALTRATGLGARILCLPDPDGMEWVRTHSGLPQRLLVICRVEAPNLQEGLRRLIALGYSPDLLMKHETFIMHQRLLRRLCSACRVELSPAVDRPPDALRAGRGGGCLHCGPIPGIRGRFPVAHALRVTDEVIRSLDAGAESSLEEACSEAGLVSLERQVLDAVASGMIDPDEISASARSVRTKGAAGASAKEAP
jgi:type II secretory ATPase GspE/PulE/Tfp pilus assembly ATPase PilB-like protein